MLRTILIYLSKAAWARKIVTHWRFAWRAASRFVAGETLDDAIKVVIKLNEKGINATLDHLGENTYTDQDALRSTDEILLMLEAISIAGVRSNVSIKLTQIGLKLDPAMCVNNLTRILNLAKEKGNFIRIDMEDSCCVDETIRIFNEMRLEKGFPNVGLVIQSYLYRSMDDVAKLMEIGTRIRLCKGAYKEPSDIAYPKKRDVDANYDRIARVLMDNSLKPTSPRVSDDGLIPPIPGLATHDLQRIDAAIRYQNSIGLSKSGVEFQMLHGIRRDIQNNLVEQGYPVRVYVPYGTEWYPYFVRRLAERPANVWFFISNFFRA